MQVTSVPPPPTAFASGGLARVDYQDAFRLALPEGAPETIDEIARRTILATPSWVRELMAARDGIVRHLGLKTGGRMRALPERFVVGDRVGIFRVVARSEREIVVGEDDAHLDFRVSFLLDGAVDRALVLSTIVCFHRALGRAYFLPVAPVHRRIVPAMLRAAGRAMAGA